MFVDLFFNALIGTICFINPLCETTKNRYKAIMFISSILFYYLLYGTPYPAVVIVPFNLFIVLLSTKNRAINGIAALIGYISSVACNNVMIIGAQKIFNMEAQVILTNKKALLIFYFCFLIVVFIITTIIGKLFKRFVSKSDFAKAPSTLVLIFIELLLCATILVFNITYARQLGYPQNTILFNCLLFFVYFVLSSLLLVNIVNSTKKNLKIEQELETAKQLQEYTETIEYHASKMREFKHDYINVLLTMDELVHESKNQELITYFDEHIKPTGVEVQNINTSLVALKHIHDTALKSLLYNKLSFALSKGIELHLFLNFDIAGLTINSMDLAKLAGIFLDNAIEASLMTEKPTLSVVFSKNTAITLEISNNFSGNVLNISRLSEKGYSTKGTNRGLGLANAEAILDKYPELLHSVKVENDIFIQSITLV